MQPAPGYPRPSNPQPCKNTESPRGAFAATPWPSAFLAPENTVFSWKSLLATHPHRATRLGQSCREAAPTEKQSSQLSPELVNAQELKAIWYSY